MTELAEKKKASNVASADLVFAVEVWDGSRFLRTESYNHMAVAVGRQQHIPEDQLYHYYVQVSKQSNKHNVHVATTKLRHKSNSISANIFAFCTRWLKNACAALLCNRKRSLHQGL